MQGLRLDLKRGSDDAGRAQSQYKPDGMPGSRQLWETPWDKNLRGECTREREEAWRGARDGVKAGREEEGWTDTCRASTLQSVSKTVRARHSGYSEAAENRPVPV